MTTYEFNNGMLSIHALLAESDAPGAAIGHRLRPFYPRSPCGERRVNEDRYGQQFWSFLSTLSLRRATCWNSPRATMHTCFLSTLSLRRATNSLDDILAGVNLSIHALLAESDGGFGVGSWRLAIFLSTLSLRRATVHYDNYNLHCVLSIHALLAESDSMAALCQVISTLSIHALLAESDKSLLTSVVSSAAFYPRSPCGERLNSS